jgi:Caspase domain
MGGEETTKRSDNDEHNRTVATTVGLPSPAEAQVKPSDAKVKDAWDKAQIISGFVASVVIAAVGLLINSSIQRAQIRASEESTRAQIEVTDRNNKAQLALTERTADIQMHIQESTLTGQLVEHLASGSVLKKQIAIVALRRSVPPEMYQDVITIVVRSDTDPKVRKTALEQASTLSGAGPSVVQAIAEAAKDTSRSSEERDIATSAVQQLGLRSIAPGTTFVLSASDRSQPAMESPKLKGGVFTHYLIRGLSGDADLRKDGSIRLSALGLFVARSVRDFTQGAQVPMVAASFAVADPIVLGPGADFSKTVVISVGNSNYHNPSMRLQFGALDAKRFADVFRRQGAVIHEVEDATRADFWTAFQAAIQDADDHSLLIFYYSGHAVVDRDGVFWLLPVDADLRMLVTTAISTAELNQTLSHAPARVKILFVDSAFAGSVIEGPSMSPDVIP